MIIARKTFTAAITALALGATLAATITPAEARNGRNALAIGALAVGALAVGAIAANANARSCHVERRAVTNRWGDVVGVRNVRVCH